MQIINQAKYDEWVTTNHTHLLKGMLFRYAERWANLMEDHINQGTDLSVVVVGTSHEADTEGASGSIVLYATRLLCETWKYGDELRKWAIFRYGADF